METLPRLGWYMDKKGVRVLQAPAYRPDAEQVSGQLACVLTSKVFIRSPRLCRFLRFVVEQTHRFTRIPILRVVALATRTSLAGIPRSLRVDMILRGSVRHSPGRVRVIAQLIASKSRDYLWSETYDEKIVDLFATQENIAR